MNEKYRTVLLAKGAEIREEIDEILAFPDDDYLDEKVQNRLHCLRIKIDLIEEILDEARE